MGGWVSFSINIIVIYSFYRLGNTTLVIVSAINAVVSFWSFGVMHNYGSYSMREEAARLEENLKAEGNFDEEAKIRLDELSRRTNPKAVPDWITIINLASFIISVCLLITFFVLRY